MPWPKRYWKIGQTRRPLALGEAASDRLLDDDVEAGLERVDRLGLVQPRGRADVDDVEIALEQPLEPVDGGGDGELRRHRLPALGVDVAERRDLVQVGELPVALDVRGADARPDDSDLQPPHRFSAPSATPRMISRWKARKTANTGTSDRADMAKSSP
jgi:hypothetical protein